MATNSAWTGGMGLGLIGGPDIVFKRKYRWTMAITPYCGNTSIPPNFVKLASRPNLTIEETEINFLNGKMFIPGKGTWETITVTYYDVGGNNASSYQSQLYSWLASVYNFTGVAPQGNGSSGGAQGTTNTTPTGVNVSSNLQQSSNPGSSGGIPGYGADATLALYDGCGTVMETWTLVYVWPQAINFGELDYSSSEEVTIELTLRYQNAIYSAACPGGSINPCCAGC